jgi:hypothetical protein
VVEEPILSQLKPVGAAITVLWRAWPLVTSAHRTVSIVFRPVADAAPSAEDLRFWSCW